MTKKTRLTILAACAVLFLIITPYIILYSLGYRVDFKHVKIVATGGIYIRALPQGSTITIDNNITDTTGIFSNAFFVQNLLPAPHSVSIKKDGYYDYQKNLDVTEKSVTKLEHVQLFKKNIIFEVITDTTKSPFNPKVITDPYVIKNNNLYYTESKSGAVSPTPKITPPIINNIVTYKVSDNNIIWLGLDGFLYSSDLGGLNTKKLIEVGLQINKKSTCEILVFNKNIFLKENNKITLLDPQTKSLTDFDAPVNDIKISPDGQKIIYFNDHQVFLSSLVFGNPDLPRLSTGNILNTFSEKIKDAYWLNDDYVVLGLENNTVISETDIRDQVNIVTLPQTVTLTNGNAITITNPKINFNQQEKRLYILTGSTLLVSEKLLP